MPFFGSHLHSSHAKGAGTSDPSKTQHSAGSCHVARFQRWTKQLLIGTHRRKFATHVQESFCGHGRSTTLRPSTSPIHTRLSLEAPADGRKQTNERIERFDGRLGRCVRRSVGGQAPYLALELLVPQLVLRHALLNLLPQLVVLLCLRWAAQRRGRIQPARRQATQGPPLRN